MDGPEIPDPYCDPNKPVSITFDLITSAAYRIKSGIRHTECCRSEHLTNLTGMEVYLKKEFQQATGSFKERGARFAMMMMPPELKKNGIVAASAGNHALACCYHGRLLGIPVTVMMPETAPIMKIQKCIDYKGNVIVKGKDLATAKRIALKYAKDNGMMYLNGYDHPKILAGTGTIGLEVWEQVPNLEAVIVPIGGGGLLAGICVAVKALDKKIKIYGVEPERAACMTAAFAAGGPVDVTVGSTLADGLAVAKIGVNSFASVKSILDRCITVKEQYIALGILRLVEYEKCVVEGAGASALAAILQGLVPELKGKTVCLILSGGNIDTTVLGRVLERGLAADGRLVKVKVCISDRVGGIEDLVTTIEALGVHIKDMAHERAWVTEDVFKVEVKVICESRDREHSLSLRDNLLKKYDEIWFNGIKYPDDMNKATAIFAPTVHNQRPMGQKGSEPEKDSIQENVVDLESSSYDSSRGVPHQPSKRPGESAYSQRPQEGEESVVCGPCGTVIIRPSSATRPSQQVVVQPSQQVTAQPSEQVYVHPSKQVVVVPSQQAYVHPTQQGPPQQIPSQPSQQQSMLTDASYLSQQQSNLPSQQVTPKPSEQPSGALQPTQQVSSHVSGQPSMTPQGVAEQVPSSQRTPVHGAPEGTLASQPTMASASQTGGYLRPPPASQESKETEARPIKAFANCACKKRGAPGNYKK